MKHPLATTLTLLIASGCARSPSPLSPAQSGTVGVPHMGVLTEGEELPNGGAGYRRFREKGSAYFGVSRLVRSIQNVAANLHAADPVGPPLIVGDLSAKHGGKVPRHNSHRSGRDVDFLFFVTTPEGIPVENPGFFPIDEDGFVRVPDGRYLQLDTKREWQFIKRLLLDREIDVQFLFMSRAIEARILDYAIRIENDYELLYRGQVVMQQPGDSLPHNDHLHMRVACSPEETIFGCMGGGPYWPWFAELPKLDENPLLLLSSVRTEDPFLLPPVVEVPFPELLENPRSSTGATAVEAVEKGTNDPVSASGTSNPVPASSTLESDDVEDG